MNEKTDTSKVVLVQPPIEDFYLSKKRTIPYGLAIIAGGIHQEGFDVEIIDALATTKSKSIDWPRSLDYLKPFYPQKDISFFSLFHEFRHFGYSYEHIGRLVREKRPFIVGIASLFTAYADQALKSAEIIKKFYPDCTIILGGHHPTQFPDQTLSHPAVDIVIRGEGEKIMAQVCRAIKENRCLDHIPGVIHKKNEPIRISSPSWITNFKDLPLPAFDLINDKFYQRKKRGSAIVVSSRGCPMQCSYCSVSASSSYAGYRCRDVEDVINEITAQITQKDIGFIDFEDENLCLNKKWFLSLFSKLSPLVAGKDIELRAMNGLYPAALDEQIVSVLKENGFKTLNLSLGTSSRQQLKRFKRPDIKKAYETALDLAKKYDLECVSYLIAGAPGQEAEQSLDDLIYLAQRQTLVGLSIFYPAPGSVDYNTCKEANILPASFDLMRSSALPISDTTTRIQAATLLRLSRITNFLKYLKDSHIDEPLPEAFPDKAVFNPNADRLMFSIQLLKWFLHDGKIRGITPTGDLFEHQTDPHLTRSFITKLSNIKVRGAKQQAPVMSASIANRRDTFR